ncbi:hypothetical protein ACRCPT_06970 [Pseudomonas aeruginosa]|nr:hypothetical protein [Pseudomonas aeruginosa]MCV4061263.1 hypothetical protein [Pseudomonas aeruginosa]MCV4077252.1 hypothetical protein [Pseudomonas aeruginosa]MCV4148677.1 hypothetical protein [Pseudomonas aeruginosa]MCV4180520.1 hypothetical protein [Pseudomonas aeruginosa]MCV4219983.1 hypothetical protein [Pseudomonas aeruginosa]
MGYVNGIWHNHIPLGDSLIRAAELATAQAVSFPAMPMTHVWMGEDNNLASKLNRNKAMQKHTALPVADGLYWYFENGKSEPRPVMINKERWGAVDEIV